MARVPTVKAKALSGRTQHAWRTLPAVLLLWLLAPSGMLAQHQPPTDITVASAADFLVAMGTPSVLVIRITADVTLAADAVIPGASPSCNASEVYRLTRNVTVAGPLGMDGAADVHPTLDLSEVM